MVMFFTDIHDEKISASNMREAAIKAILLAYYKDLSHSTNYLKLTKLIKKANSVEVVLNAEEWADYEFEKPQPKTHVMIYGKKKNTCYQLASFERVTLKDVEMYMINRRKLVLPVKGVSVKVVTGKYWKTRKVGVVAKELDSVKEPNPTLKMEQHEEEEEKPTMEEDLTC